MATFTTTRSSGSALFVCVTLPISLRRAFTYRLSAAHHLDHPIGHRVVVPFAGKLAIGIITSLPSTPPTHPVKEVLASLDDTPLCSPTHLRFLQWISDYYLCPLGKVLHAAFASTPVWDIFIEKKPALHLLTPTDTTTPFIHTLQTKHRLTYTQATSLLPSKALVHTLHTLIQQKAVQLTSPLTPQEPYFSLPNEAYDTNDSLLTPYTEQAFTTPAQKRLLQAYRTHITTTKQRWVPQTSLLHAGCSLALLTRLEKKGLLLTKNDSLSPPPTSPSIPPPPTQASQQLSEPQAATRVSFLPSNASTHAALSTTIATLLFHKKKRFLCIAPNLETFTTWQQALTPLLGDKLLLWSSLQSTRDKQLTWHTLRQGHPTCLLATPPALLLPFPKADHLIVIDEASPDHKAAHNPRYHARDAAILYASYHDAKVLLTSPTPSLETYHNITQGKYTQLTPILTPTPASIKERLTILPRPRIHHILTPPLIKKLTTAFSQQKKVAILHPRRGYAAYTSCKQCHWQAQCPDCHLGLVYHQTTHQLHCHHCKRTFPPFPRCPECHATTLHYARTGTQELMEACALHFPHVRTACIDADHTPYKKKYTETLSAFARHDLDCLIGTQRLLRALPNLQPDLIVIIDLPLWSSQGNFRRTEHQHATLHSLLAYTSASFLLTTTQTHRHKLTHLLDSTTAFYTQELQERHTYHYPPYHKLLTITLRHPDSHLALQAAHTLASNLTAQQAPHPLLNILGPLPLPKHKNHAQVALWLPHTSQAIKPTLLAAAHALSAETTYKKLKIGFNVDPY